MLLSSQESVTRQPFFRSASESAVAACERGVGGFYLYRRWSTVIDADEEALTRSPILLCEMSRCFSFALFASDSRKGVSSGPVFPRIRSKNSSIRSGYGRRTGIRALAVAADVQRCEGRVSADEQREILQRSRCRHTITSISRKLSKIFRGIFFFDIEWRT